MSYEQKRKVAEIVLEILTDDDTGIPNLPMTEAIEYGQAIYAKLVEEGVIKED